MITAIIIVVILLVAIAPPMVLLTLRKDRKAVQIWAAFACHEVLSILTCLGSV